MNTTPDEIGAREGCASVEEAAIANGGWTQKVWGVGVKEKHLHSFITSSPVVPGDALLFTNAGSPVTVGGELPSHHPQAGVSHEEGSYLRLIDGCITQL